MACQNRRKSAPQAVKDWSQILNDRLVCKICKHGLRVQMYRWYHCQDYHQICKTCFNVLSQIKENCNCGKVVVNKHCETTEELLKSSTMKFKCTNLKRGCQEFLCEESMIAHQKECVYRQVFCPYGTCGSYLPFIGLIDHMKEKNDDHNLQAKLAMKKGSKVMAFGYIKNGPQTIQVEFDDRMFIFRGEIRQETCYFWVQLVGSPLGQFSHSQAYKLTARWPGKFIIDF